MFSRLVEGFTMSSSLRFLTFTGGFSFSAHLHPFYNSYEFWPFLARTFFYVFIAKHQLLSRTLSNPMNLVKERRRHWRKNIVFRKTVAVFEYIAILSCIYPHLPFYEASPFFSCPRGKQLTLCWPNRACRKCLKISSRWANTLYHHLPVFLA